MIFQLCEQIIGSSESSDHKDSLYVMLWVRRYKKSNGTHFDHFGRLPGLFFYDFDNVLYGRFEKVRNFGAKIQWSFRSIKFTANVYLMSLMLPDRISYCGSFSLRPKRIKCGFEDPLKLGFVVLSKYLVMTSMSSGIPNLDPRSFPIQHN